MAARKSKCFWAAHICSAETSGLSKAAYCRRHGLDYRTFHRWFRRLDGNGAGAQAPQALVPIAVQSPSRKADAGEMTLRVGADVVLLLPAGVDATWLARLLREAAAC